MVRAVLEMNATEPIADELLRYVRFTTDDARRIASFLPHAEPHFRRIAVEFYERIREHEDAHAVLSGEDQIVRLQGSMVAWLERLFSGVYDAEYFARTEKVGRVHVKVGLPQRYMPAAMAVIRSALGEVIDRVAPDDAPALRDALSRLLDVELAVMLESYREDMTARIQKVSRAEQLVRSDAHYARAIELAPVLVVALDEKGAIVIANAEAARVSGHARDEMLGRPFVETLLPEEEREKARAALSGKAREIELPLATRAGKVRDVRWHLAPVSDLEPIRMIAFGMDVTEMRAETLRHRQQERLAAVGTLAAGLAHEIRNPLNGALLHVSFLERALKKSGGDREALDAVHVVGDEIKRLAHLVTDFLDFARPRPLAFTPTSARLACERAAHMVATAAQAGKVDLELDLPASDVVFPADGARLEQVLLNLLQNAIEALSPHGGHVILRARREPRHVWLEVEDDGPGIPAGNPPVFDAFFSTKPEGTGLGLSIVHRIVTDHGGTIDLDSRPGRTRFRVKLPLNQQGTKS